MQYPLGQFGDWFAPVGQDARDDASWDSRRIAPPRARGGDRLATPTPRKPIRRRG